MSKTKTPRQDAVNGFRGVLFDYLVRRHNEAADDFIKHFQHDPMEAAKHLGREEAYNDIMRWALDDGPLEISKNNGRVSHGV
jgi:hypothetical protein